MNIHILFGIAKNGGNDIYIEHLLNDSIFQNDVIKIIGDNKLYTIAEIKSYYGSSKIKNTTFLNRINKSLAFFSKKNPYKIIYLSNSILVILMGFIHLIKPIKSKVIWIAQGCEVYIQNKPKYKINLYLLLYFQKWLRIEIIALNKYLSNWFIRNNFKNVKHYPLSKLPEINIADLATKNNEKTYDLIFILRKEKCKGSHIANIILKHINEAYKSKIIVIDMHKQYKNEDWVSKVLYMNQLPHEKLLELFKKTKYLLYPSYFEGYGLSIIEALNQGCIPIIGPENIFFEQKEIPLIRSSSNDPKMYTQIITNLLREESD